MLFHTYYEKKTSYGGMDLLNRAARLRKGVTVHGAQTTTCSQQQGRCPSQAGVGVPGFHHWAPVGSEPACSSPGLLLHRWARRVTCVLIVCHWPPLQSQWIGLHSIFPHCCHPHSQHAHFIRSWPLGKPEPTVSAHPKHNLMPPSIFKD